MMVMMMILFVVWLTDEKRVDLCPAGTTVRGPYHHESPTRRELESVSYRLYHLQKQPQFR